MQNKKNSRLFNGAVDYLSHELDKKRIKPASHVGMWTLFANKTFRHLIKIDNFSLSKKLINK